jgi:hypothetical protein
VTAHAALGGRSRPLGFGALLAGCGWLACGRIELGSYARDNGANAGGAGGADSIVVGAAGGQQELAEPTAAPSAMEGASGAPVELFGAAKDGPGAREGDASANGDIDSNVVEVLDEPDAGELDAGDLDVADAASATVHFPDGEGRSGHRDLAGSLSEWLFDSAGATFPVECARPDTSIDFSRVSRRGSGYDSSNLALLAHTRRSQDPAVRYPRVGFRCASNDFL